MALKIDDNGVRILLLIAVMLLSIQFLPFLSVVQEKLLDWVLWEANTADFGLIKLKVGLLISALAVFIAYKLARGDI